MGRLSRTQLAAMRSSLSGGLEWVFIIVALDAAVVAAVALRFMPTVHVERRASDGPQPAAKPLPAAEAQ